MRQYPLEGSEYITLGQLLKSCGVISTGGYAKRFLQEEEVRVNGVREERRGRKLYPGDVVEFPEGVQVEVVQKGAEGEIKSNRD